MTDNKTERRALKFREFLETYGLGKSKAHEEINAGRLKARKLGRDLIVSADDAEAWFNSLPERKPRQAA